MGWHYRRMGAEVRVGRQLRHFGTPGQADGAGSHGRLQRLSWVHACRFSKVETPYSPFLAALRLICVPPGGTNRAPHKSRLDGFTIDCQDTEPRPAPQFWDPPPVGRFLQPERRTSIAPRRRKTDHTPVDTNL